MTRWVVKQQVSQPTMETGTPTQNCFLTTYHPSSIHPSIHTLNKQQGDHHPSIHPLTQQAARRHHPPSIHPSIHSLNKQQGDHHPSIHPSTHSTSSKETTIHPPSIHSLNKQQGDHHPSIHPSGKHPGAHQPITWCLGWMDGWMNNGGLLGAGSLWPGILKLLPKLGTRTGKANFQEKPKVVSISVVCRLHAIAT
jgi:hypothetical protein